MKKLLCLLLSAAMLSMTACQEQEDVVTGEEEQVVVKEMIEEEKQEEIYNVEAALENLNLENYPYATELSIEKVKEYLSDKSPAFVQEFFTDEQYLNHILHEEYWIKTDDEPETEEPKEETPAPQPETPVTPPQQTAPQAPNVEYFDTRMLNELYGSVRAMMRDCMFDTDHLDGAALFVDELKEILSDQKIITLNEKQISENVKNLEYDSTGAHIHYFAQILGERFEPYLTFYDDYIEVKYYDEIFYLELSESEKQAVIDLIVSFNEGKYDNRLNQ